MRRRGSAPAACPTPSRCARPSAAAASQRAPSGASSATSRRSARCRMLCPASSPVMRRMAVPELPMSSAWRRGFETRATDAAHANLARRGLLDLHAQRAHRAHRRKTVFAFEETANFGDAFGDAAEHERAMRDGLVAGNADGSGDVRGGLNEIRSHDSAAALRQRSACCSAASIRSFCSRVPMVTRR